SPLPGSVIKVLVSEGQAVKKGDTLLTLESMKMENAIMAECDGTVAKIAVTAGQNVMQDDLLVVLN
ncbi:MAG: biotin/lipoyl-containing protein, partial [Paludibacteraceae bacterium]